MQPCRLFPVTIIIAITVLWIGCDFRPKWEDFQGGLHLVVEVAASGDAHKDQENTARIMEKIAKRMSALGIKNKIIARERDRIIIVQVPPVKNRQRISEFIVRSAVLEFKLVVDEGNLQSALQGNVPYGSEILYEHRYDTKTGQFQKMPWLVKQKVALSSNYLSDAKVQIDSRFNSPYIAISFDDEGAKILEKITGNNINQRLAIILDNRVVSTPQIREKITGGRAQITGQFTIEKAKDTAIALKYAYPAQTRLMAVRELTEDLWLGSRETQEK